MRKDIQLTIAAPCQESWEAMQPAEAGRYCASCCKTVVDLSLMSDQEIILYLARAGHRACGRLAPEQLDRGLAVGVPAARPRKRWWHWMIAGLLLSTEASAQQGGQPIGTKPVVELVHAPGRVPAVQLARTTAVEDSIKVQELPPVVITSYGRTVGRLELVGCAPQLAGNGTGRI